MFNHMKAIVFKCEYRVQCIRCTNHLAIFNPWCMKPCGLVQAYTKKKFTSFWFPVDILHFIKMSTYSKTRIPLLCQLFETINKLKSQFLIWKFTEKVIIIITSFYFVLNALHYLTLQSALKINKIDSNCSRNPNINPLTWVSQ